MLDLVSTVRPFLDKFFFLADEAGSCGKGANVVISQLDVFFNNHGFGEKHVFLHAVNCCGQNKNNAMIQYLAWRGLTNRHSSITLVVLGSWAHEV